MEFYPKDKNPCWTRDPVPVRVLKEDQRPPLCWTLVIEITWSSDKLCDLGPGKEMWCEVDHLMMNFIQAKTSETRQELEDKINRGVVQLLKGPDTMNRRRCIAD